MKSVYPNVSGQPMLLAKNQPQYIPLPCVVDGEVVHTQWKLTLGERLRLLATGNLFASFRTFGQPFQPMRLSTKPIGEPK